MIYPAIDLMDGGCVRLFKGDFDLRTNYDGAPTDVAASFAKAGAKWVHIVDLDGARTENAAQTDLIIEIAKSTPINVQTGGGIRNADQIAKLLNGGVSRVVLGSIAVTDPLTVMSWMDKFGADKFCLAFDVHINEAGVARPALKGWTQSASTDLLSIIKRYSAYDYGALLVTDIAKDGVLLGPNVELYRNLLARFPNAPLITSGGVGKLDDVKALKSLSPYGIIIGKALYENKFTLEEAITCSPSE
ncbi:1-(5-phosphoribosyl)-5-[(5-phosphoribosylamino)methylideneamino]imidazole-4-carboxamide isomerase [Robiginitomaculum antarcticum]|uniref:1-(5-phosphoribosyl)-5-[(5- phosphoribosylamino)methylideneamino]imidazole-4- carboxamide isomerase n=1 Tax=Robiginitomaculum antarcticum TaxID=437507 RepID=UPI00036E1BD7|nr:1-(5-phosphoribosyl)-5-[(5-phosphoribosylamino)methylideneamino]imidazole-4-carboxamide isomerase [Robiginitomaculum antarcticum]